MLSGKKMSYLFTRSLWKFVFLSEISMAFLFLQFGKNANSCLDEAMGLPPNKVVGFLADPFGNSPFAQHDRKLSGTSEIETSFCQESFKVERFFLKHFLSIPSWVCSLQCVYEVKRDTLFRRACSWKPMTKLADVVNYWISIWNCEIYWKRSWRILKKPASS